MRGIIFSVVALALGACQTTSGGDGDILLSNNVSEVAAICDIQALEGQRDAMRIDQSRAQSSDLRARVREFNVEIDAQYRAVTSSCKAFSRCMQQNDYIETRCEQTLNRWERADARFATLAETLRRIEADIDKEEINANSGLPLGAPSDDVPVLNNGACDCSGALGGVFSTCCSDN